MADELVGVQDVEEPDHLNAQQGVNLLAERREGAILDVRLVDIDGIEVA